MDLLRPSDLSDEQLDHLLREAEHWFEHNRGTDKRADRLGGRSIALAFFENSTRTLLSFDMAAQRMGAMVTHFPAAQSSLAKGETLVDTALTIDAMQVDALVMRHPEPGAPETVAAAIRAAVVNAGDGTGEHPTQGLLDVATINHHFGRVEGLKVAICGDIRHSRVASSTHALLERLGAAVTLAGPAALLPEGHDGPDGIDAAVAGADVVMMLRIQRERLAADLGDAPGEYLARYGLTRERFATAAPGAVVMHPGPMNREVEISGALADSEHSLISTQVEMGVAMRMAVLDLAINDPASGD
ncbi:aspartate carbamoyltransferase catalytic subunit [Sphingomicrobium astaxanthinifaciens]|uniref:aspartate carbamoyltransferase catalytic subunit n=1 Tax=Sphingomicrobium astaxanthinifaciens TaxID=1227949 RepID=UPI001FCA9D97|nr:aspartate carbamoyltransferase catalytic subunit [Sphingomicrobium astaxanthinifaciens]MCJ7420278.1 aspartate carbamoyltransferase catalytic subunit [Sphingomicrobium astaxanthinifaciens]